jgi:hypothetical protein
VPCGLYRTLDTDEMISEKNDLLAGSSSCSKTAGRVFEIGVELVEKLT